MTSISRRAFLRGGTMLALAYPFVVPSVTLAHQGGPSHGGYPDALTHYALDRAKEITRWLAGKKCFVGEVGLPQNLPHSRSQLSDEKRWAALGDHWYDYAEDRDFWVTAHGVSERYYNFYDGGYYASIWLCPGKDRIPSAPYPKVVARRGYQAALVRRHRGPYRGVNFPNAQKWIYGTHSSYKPGRYDTDYWYPTVNGYPRDPSINGGKNSYEYLYAEGVRLVRLGFRWERIQPRLGYALDKTELGRMKLSVRNAGRAGLRVILDLHNYGGYWATNSGGADGYGKARLNSSRCTKEHFRGLWRRLSSEFRGNQTVVAYDLMNEPIGHGGIAANRGKSVGKTWEEITSLVHADLRRSGDKKTILIPTYAFWSGAILKHHSGGPWIREDTKVRYSVHCFFDRTTSKPHTGGGKYALSYGEENKFRASQGY